MNKLLVKFYLMVGTCAVGSKSLEAGYKFRPSLWKYSPFGKITLVVV